MRWEVELTGVQADLQIISDSTRGGDPEVREVGDIFVLHWSEVDALTDVLAVHERFREIATYISAYCRLTLGSQTPIGLGTMTKIDDGTRQSFCYVALKSILTRPPCLGILTLGATDGTAERWTPPYSAPGWLTLAEEDDGVAKVLRLWDVEDADWAQLFRIYEVIKDDVGRRHILVSGWAEDADITRFTHSADNPAASGDSARHGSLKYAPPKNPMSLESAQTMIANLTRSWIESKVSKSG